ncbi:Aste57867_21280 [Aphanomyces stellatus]|uniref:Aste57867_21280 protein n=1 Tax=Aphanomyces stellatus TaxID=120398 RepID=A0A485LH31_9STRA|nr:hypothetical protein As57867_021211 [Aphanomyces stellatus]VFT97952.1 Aste57867_21280 [Aphanomyces stellatus]
MMVFVRKSFDWPDTFHSCVRQVAFPSIQHFRHVVAAVREKATFVGRDDQDRPVNDDTQPLPVLTFQGTTKLHGSNCAIVFPPEGGAPRTFHSRARQLTPRSDNLGFATYMTARHETLAALRRAM